MILPLTRSNGKYIIERTWVKAVIDGKEYQLDVNFKKFTPAGSISDEIKAQNFDLDFNNYTTLSEADALFNEYKNQASLTDINLSSRKLINRRITKLPLNLPYICGKILEETHNIYESTIVTTDSITIYFGGKDYSVTAPRAYISPISIEYVPSSYFYDLYDGIIDKPSSIYASNNDYFTANQKTIAPALYIDNKKVYEWNSRVAIGDKQQMVIVTNTSGQERRYTESRELIVGSIVSIVVDTQVISPQSLLTAYENYKNIKDTINEKNFFESSYCDNYLNFIGNTYFAQLDIQNTIYSSAYNIYKERELSFGLFNYEPNVETKSVMGYITSTTLQKQGHFGLDILGVYNQALSLSGNDNDVKSYLFASGYVSSYLESQTLQQFTGVKSVSTAEVFRQCNENGIDLKMVSSENKEIIETLQISTEDKAEITQKVNDGYLVIVPEKNITINQWTGTAYIVQSRDGTQNTFIITGDKNGGYSTMDIVAYMIIATIGSGVDMFGMVFGFVGIISALLALPVAPVIAVAAAITAMVVFAKLVIMWIEDYQETVDLYFRALDGNGGNPSCNQGGIAVVAFTQNQRDEVRDLGDHSAVVCANAGTKQQTFVLQGSMIGREDKNGPQGDGINEDVSFTLNTVERHAVYSMTTGSFTQVSKEKATTVLARDYKDPTAVCYGIGRDTFNQGQNAKFAPTFEEELQPTLVAKGPGAIQSGYNVRRLTPTECARLQGFPDSWCADLGKDKPTDEERYFWHKVFKTYSEVTGCKMKSDKQVAKWLKGPYSDSAEYKMWGNGVALPCVWFVLCGIV